MAVLHNPDTNRGNIERLGPRLEGQKTMSEELGSAIILILDPHF